MPALFPMMVGPEVFRPGDCVRKFITQDSLSPFSGVVTHIVPATSKVWVQWPVEHAQESPETLIKVNPAIFGLPTAILDSGYNSYEKQLSEKLYGKIPKRVLADDKMAIRVAHTFCEGLIKRLVDDVISHKEAGLTDIQTYNRVYRKYSSVCPDHIVRYSIQKLYDKRP